MLEFTIGLLVGVFANILYRKFTYFNKPKIKVSGQLIKTKNRAGQEIVRAKIVNQSSVEIIDIKLVLYGINYLDTAKENKSIFEISSNTIDFLKNKNDKQSDYAYQTAFKYYENGNENSSIHNKLNNDNFDAIMIIVKAINPYHSSILVEHYTYPFNEILDSDFRFDTKQSCTALKNS
jgi:hypothetical protein